MTVAPTETQSTPAISLDELPDADTEIPCECSCHVELDEEIPTAGYQVCFHPCRCSTLTCYGCTLTIARALSEYDTVIWVCGDVVTDAKIRQL